MTVPFSKVNINTWNKRLKIKQNFMNIKVSTNRLLHILFLIISFFMILPVIFVVIISFSDQMDINKYGYSFFPPRLTLQAYQFVFSNAHNVMGALLISILITVFGTVLSTFLISSYAYVISRRTFKYRKFFTIIALIPMLIATGLVANYLLMVNFLKLKNNFLALILPLAMNSFFVFILRSFFQAFIPESLIESAKIDGASELKIFFRIIVPIAKPGIATIALFQTLAYWNDWFNAMLYIDDAKKFPIQYLLIKTENTMLFLKEMASKMGIAVENIQDSIPTDTLRMAVVVIIIIPIALSYPFFQRFFVKGLTVGSIKE